MIAKILLFLMLALPVSAFAAVDLSAYGVLYNGTNETTAVQAALDAGVPLIISGTVKVATVNWTHLGTDLVCANGLGKFIGYGTGYLKINTSAGFGILDGVTFDKTCRLQVSATANVTPRDGSSGVISNVSTYYLQFLTSGQTRATTTGLTVQNITIPDPNIAGITYSELGAISGLCTGVVFDNIITSWSVGNGANTVINIAGSSNEIKNSSPHIADARNFLKFYPANYNFGIWVNSNFNSIHDNAVTVLDAIEETIGRDSFGHTGAATGVLSSVSGSNIIATWTNKYLAGDIPSQSVGLTLAVKSGAGRGQYYFVTGYSGSTLTLNRVITASAGDVVSLEEGFGENEFYNNSVTIDPSSDPANIPAGITLWGSSFGNYVHDNTLPIQGAYERSFDSSVQGYMSAFANRFESNTFIGGSAHWPFDSWSYKMNSSTDAPVPSVAPDYPCEGLIFRNNTLMTTGPAPVLAYSRNVTWEDNTGFLPPVGITYDGSIHYVDPASVGVTFVSYILPGAPSPPTTTIKRIDGSAAGSLKHLDGSAAGVIEKHVGGSWQ